MEGPRRVDESRGTGVSAPPVGEPCWLILSQPGTISRLPALSTSAAVLSGIVLPLNKPEVEAVIDRRPWLLTAHKKSQFSP